MLTIITGGSNGIGLATCQELIKKDANNYCAIVDLVEPNFNLFKENQERGTINVTVRTCVSWRMFKTLGNKKHKERNM